MADAEAVQGSTSVSRPTHTVLVSPTNSMSLQFATCDYRGLSDGRSVRTIVGQLAPRQLVFIAGSRQATQELAKATAADLKKYNSRVMSPGERSQRGRVQ